MTTSIKAKQSFKIQNMYWTFGLLREGYKIAFEIVLNCFRHHHESKIDFNMTKLIKRGLSILSNMMFGDTFFLMVLSLGLPFTKRAINLYRIYVKENHIGPVVSKRHRQKDVLLL